MLNTASSPSYGQQQKYMWSCGLLKGFVKMGNNTMSNMVLISKLYMGYGNKSNSWTTE